MYVYLDDSPPSFPVSLITFLISNISTLHYFSHNISTSEAIVFLLLPKELTGPPFIFSLPLTQMIFCFVYFCRKFKSVLEIVLCIAKRNP